MLIAFLFMKLMTNPLILVCIFFFALFTTVPSFALEKVFVNDPPICMRADGQPVAIFSHTGVTTVSIAVIKTDGTELIAFNPDVFETFSEITRLFILTHECAHLQLGHLKAASPNKHVEKDADCWAAGKLSREGKLDSAAIAVLTEDLLKHNGANSDGLHKPVADRVAEFSRCFEPLAAKNLN